MIGYRERGIACQTRNSRPFGLQTNQRLSRILQSRGVVFCVAEAIPLDRLPGLCRQAPRSPQQDNR